MTPRGFQHGACGLLLAALLLTPAKSAATGVTMGLNWTPGHAPAGETPQSALARFGGSVYREYGNPWSGDTDRARMRLVRYGMTYQVPNALPGTTWQLANEPNLQEQDAILRYQTGAVPFAQWFKTMRDQIKAYDPTAIIIGPSMWNWDGAGSGCCTTGQQAYQWFVEAHQSLYGMPPRMDYMAVQIYPWSPMYWDNPHLAVPIGLQQVSGAQAWSAGRWPVIITEWGMLRKPFFTCTTNPQQTEQERSLYTSGMLQGFANLGVPLALYYGSHEQAPCDGNGWMSWLINGDGSLTAEGLAHTGVVAVPLSATPTATPPPSLTTAPSLTSTPTVPPTSTPTQVPAATFTRTVSPTSTPVPFATVTRTPTLPTSWPPCVPGRRCPPTPVF